jgi:predicted O-methyltransferase YrrM
MANDFGNCELGGEAQRPEGIRGVKEMGANLVIDKIYRTRLVRDASGNEYDLSSEVDPAEGDYLYRLVSSDNSITKTLEVGCAHGLSSLHICEALRNRPNACHVIIDPKQMTVWHGIGIAHLQQAGIDFFNFIPQPSELALPELLRSQPGSFDLVFIDGWHTFDHTMLDLFYANRLVRVGGYIIVDDCQWVSISAAVSYYRNYPAFEQVESIRAHTGKQRIARAITKVFRPGLARLILPASLYSRYYRRMCFPPMVAFKKVAEDTRSYTWFAEF